MVTETAAQPDGNTSFLRAARGGHLDKVLDHLKNNVDINTANSNGLNALHLASKDGHIHVVEELIKRGANLDAATKKGNTALHIASLAGQEEVVKLLVQHGASVNVQSQNGFTPLYMAAQENHDSVVKFLLANGANQSLATEDGFTPLAVAMQQGHDKVVAVLLENDTRGKVRLPALHIAAKKDDCKAAALLLQNEHNPDVTSKSGFTPLHISAHYGNEAIANLLLSKGANVNYSAKHNITPLHVAAKWGRANMVALLLEKGANIESKTRDGLTPLHCAARSGHEQVVDMLLERGAPISSKTKNGLSPLHMSAQGDFVDAARILLYHRAPVDDVTVDYLTALHVAAHCGNVRVAKLLLDRKADPNARALNGFTPLHIACKKNHIKVVELLLKQGASIEVTTESGLTPLHVASFMGAMNIVIFLLQNGANPDIPTVRGETPLHLAARANQTDIIRILLRNNAQVDARAREQQTPLHIASRLGNVDIVMLLLQHGAQVDSTTKDLYSALHIAAKEGQDEVASILLDNGASLNCTTKKGFTPSHLAAKHGHMKVASLLLQKDAPVDAQGKNGVTPLHVASHYDHQNVALLLLDKGASPHATAKNGHTPIHIAARKNQMDIATTLLEYGAKADVESKAGFTPLHLSSQEGHSDMSSLLIEHHADVNHKAKNGLTPLHLCAQEDKVNVASILIKNGAEVNAITKTGFTPLHVASHFGQLNMVRLLLAHDADPKITTNLGYSPLHQAAQQGHSTIVAILLDNGASPNIVNHQGQTALSIARKLGYISVVEVLKKVTDAPDNQIQITATDEKYKVVSPETMQENFLSDSEDEGGEDTILNEQPYRYLTVDEMKSLGDDSLPIDVTRDERFDSNLMMAMDDSISPQHSYNQMSAPIDNIDIKHQPNIGFLVSFLVDARGGAMRGCRHSGVRVIVPPRCASMPTRVTCRYLRRDKLSHPPPLMEGEALASRILELGPIGAKFLGPVMLEVPHFGSLRGSEREIVILRSDNGETWREHTIDNCDDIIQEVLSHSFEKEEQTQHDDTTRLTRIVTTEFPHYFAVVSRIRQEVHAIGPEGGMVSSSVVSQVQAVFPEGALTKKIKVGLQSQPIPGELVSKLLGNRVGVSPIVTVEPRRRKFHKPITLTIPVPQAASKGMINQYSGDAPTLRLLCSITGGTTRAQWEDVTGSTPLTFVNDCVSFTTTVSARFWLMDCRNVGDATKMATELYREAIHVPFMAKFVVFVKRIDSLEARLRIFCMTDDKEDKTLEHQEHFTEVAKSRDVEVLEGKSQYIEFAGNLVPVTKSGDQLKLGFRAFRENRLPFMVKVKDPHADPVGRVLFMREPKVAKGEPPQHPACVLNIVLPETIIPETGLSHSVEELNKFSYLQSSDTTRVDLRLSDISNLLGDDWVSLASELGLSNTEINTIKTDHPGSNAQLALAMLRYWFQQHGDQASAKELESSLTRIGRSDIVQQCIPQQESQKTSYQSSHIIKNADYATVKKQKDPIHEADDHDEKKYTAEEKVVEEEETKKSVQERKQEIEKRLSLSKNIDVILDQKPSEKRKSLIASDSQSSEKEKETVEEKRVSVVDPDVGNLADELADLTFEQKRLSFEKGASLEKKKSEEKPFDGVQTSFDKGVSLERKISVDKPLEISKPTSEPRISEDKVEQTGGKVSDSIKTESAKIIEAEKQLTEQGKSQASTETEEKQLSFQEKRLSFERGLSQTSITPVLKEKTEISIETKETGPTAEEKRRNSVLFEGVSQGLEKLDTTPDKFSQPPQDLLSPKVVKTPPPSPAEFKDPAWSNSSSQSSQEGKAPDVDVAAQEAAKNNVADSPTSDTTGKSETNWKDPQAVDKHEQLTRAPTISSPSPQVLNLTNLSSNPPKSEQSVELSDSTTDAHTYSVQTTKKFWEKISSSSTSSDDSPVRSELPSPKPEAVSRAVKPIAKQRTLSVTSSVSIDNSSGSIDVNSTDTSSKVEVLGRDDSSAKPMQPSAGIPSTDNFVNVATTIAESFKESRNTKSIDSETEYIGSHPSEYFAYENPALKIDTTDLSSRFLTERESGIFDKRYSECLNEIPPITIPRKTIHERSASLPCSELSDESIRTRKRIFESQIKKEMVVDQLMTQLEEESSLEYKTISDTEKRVAEVTQEDMINRQIHTHIFRSEINEQIDSSIPEHKQIGLEKTVNETQSLETIEAPYDDTIQVVSSEVVNEIISESMHQVSHLSSYDESNSSTDLPETSLEPLSSNLKAWPKDSGEVHIDKSELESTEKGIEREGPDRRTFDPDKEPVPSITYSLSGKQQTDSSDQSVDTQSESDVTPADSKDKQIWDTIEYDIATSTLIDKQVVCTPEEHVPDTVWEVPIQENEQEVYDQGVPIEAQEHFEGGLTEKMIESSSVNEKEIRTMAEGVIADIESVLSGKNMDFLSSDAAQSKLSEFLESMHESGVDKSVSKDLIESVIAKKHRENMQRMFRTDTNTSSVEITDEDLRSTGVETDLSLQDCKVQGSLETRRISSYEDLSADVFEKSPEDAPQAESSTELEDASGPGEKTTQSPFKAKDKESGICTSKPTSASSLESEVLQINKPDKDIIVFTENSEHTPPSTEIIESGAPLDKLIANVPEIPLDLRSTQTSNAEKTSGPTVPLDVGISQITAASDQCGPSAHQSLEKGVKSCPDSSGMFEGTKEELSRIESRKKDVEVGEAVFLDACPETTPSLKEHSEETKCIISESFLPEEIDEPISESSGVDDDQLVALSDPPKKLLKKRSKDIKKTGNRRSGADHDVNSSSSESNYQSCEQTDTKTPSRPLSSDVEALLTGTAGTACSSEYESAMSREISSRSNIGTSSHDYHTAVSSLSSRESMKSLSSESSGNLASVEISSEASETLIASTLELDRDDVMSATTIDEDEFKSQQVFEPYETDIPTHVICGDSSPFKTHKQDTYDDDYDSEGMRYPGGSQRMKRSHEMTFQPEPHAVIPEHSMSDSVTQVATLVSSTEDPIGSLASSSSDMASSRCTVIEMEKKCATGPSSEQWSLNISGSSDQFSLSSESKEEFSLTPTTVGTVTNEAVEPQACSSVTILSSVVSENGIESVGTQITSRHSSSPQPEVRSKIPQPSRFSTGSEDDADSNVGKKVGHRRNESTSISQSRIPVAVRGETQSGIKFSEGLEDVAESDRYTENDRKCISALDRRELEERYEESLHTEADQGFYRDIREGKLLLDDCFPTEDDSRELDSRPHSQISKSDSESGQRLPSSTFSDDRPDSELASLLQQGSSDGAFEDPIERPPTPEPPATPETPDIFDKQSEAEPGDDGFALKRDPHSNCYDGDDYPDSPSNASPEVQLEKERVYEFSCSPELESCMTVARDKTPFQHNGDHEEELAEAEAAFHVVPRLTPTVPASLPPTILEDPAAENYELEEREMQMRKAALRKAERLSVGSIPDITVTQHMAPLDDKEFQYPDLENEIAADSAAASMSSKTSSETTETDQGQEYVVNDDEISCTTGETSAATEEKTAFETECVSKQGSNDVEKQSITESPNSDSFELLEKPDLIDDFVVIEEVAKEANELDTEGKSVHIKKRVVGKVSALKLSENDGDTNKIGKTDNEDGDEDPTVFKTQAKMTNMTYYGAGGLPEDLSFPLDESPTDKNSPSSDLDFKDEVEDGKKWLEMQFEGVTSAAAEYGYEGEFSHAPLEDIKEEDVTDLESSKVGSAGSQVSQSFGSLGSDKKSLSSTPEYDVLAGKKYFSKSNEKDNISVSSLQEFEKLEQLMAVEALKRSQGSQDSLDTWSSGSKKPHHSYDNISFTSLKEYEGLELACIEAEIIQKKAKDEEALLSQIEEGHESQASESESCETISAMKGNDSNSEDYEKRMFEIDEIIRQAQSNVEQFAERTESMGRGDSLEEVSRVPELELDKPLVSPIRSQPEIYSGKKFIQQWPDVDDEMAISTDSLDFKPPHLKAKLSDHLTSSTDSLELKSDVMSASTDSIEFQQKQKKMKQSSMTDSLEIESRVCAKVFTETYEDSSGYELDSEDYRYGSRSQTTDSSNTTVICRDVMGSSTDSLEPSSSAGTHATYHYENESLMSSSAGSNTLMSSAENLANSARAGIWFEDGRPYVTEKIEPLEGDEEGYTHTIHRTVEMPPQIHKVTFTGPNAEKALQDYIAKFGPGEDVSETHEVDSEGQLHIKRVVQRRVVLKPEDLQTEPDVDCDSYSKHSEERTESFPGTERQSSDDLSDFSSSIKSSVEFHHISSHRHSPSVLDTRGFTNIPYSEGEQAAVESGASGVESEEAASGTQGKTDKSS